MEELEGNLDTARARAERKAIREQKAAEKAARAKRDVLAAEEAPVEKAASEIQVEDGTSTETPVWPPVANSAAAGLAAEAEAFVSPPAEEIEPAETPVWPSKSEETDAS